MDKMYVVISDEKFSKPMSRESAIKTVKDYDKKGITGYIVSEEEANRIGSPKNFREPKWE